MGLVIFFMWRFLEGYAYNNLWYLIALLFSTILVGAGIYILLTYLLKMEEIKFVFGLIKKLKNSNVKQSKQDNK
jgi:hypothetical protein